MIHDVAAPASASQQALTQAGPPLKNYQPFFPLLKHISAPVTATRANSK